MNIYLAFNTEKAAIIICNGPEDISSELWDGNYELHEIGLAHPEILPGCILAGTGVELTGYRPIGKKIK